MKIYNAELSTEQIGDLIAKYASSEKYQIPKDFECSYDEFSSAIIYSLVRDYKPVNCLEFGAYRGGSVSKNFTALLKNNLPFSYIACEKSGYLLQESINNVFRHCKSTPMFMGAVEDSINLIPNNLDYVFIDTSHDIENCKWYLENIFPKLVDGALVAIHDCSVSEKDGKLVYEGGTFEEIQYLIKLYESNKLPLQKLYWTWKNFTPYSSAASSYWIYKK